LLSLKRKENQYGRYEKMTEEEKDNRIKELEEFLEDVIEHPYMCGSSIWEEGRKLLNKEEDE
jgi:hypothetical protein